MVRIDNLEYSRDWKLRYKIDLSGIRFGRLVVEGYSGRRIQPNKKCGTSVWRCKCDCGNVAFASAKSLRGGNTQSCGCLKKEVALRCLGGSNRHGNGESAFNQLLGGYKLSAKNRGCEFSLSRDEFFSLTQQDCYYCGEIPLRTYRCTKGTNGSFKGNGVDRVDNSIGYISGNVVPCCEMCNRKKMDTSLEDFYDWINRAYKNLLQRGAI